jgi:hypothetical protein
VAVLHGRNGSVATDNVPETPRALAKTVTTAWVENPDSAVLASHVFSLWGMGELGAKEADVFVLSMSFSDARMRAIRDGRVVIATHVGGQWVNAVDQNVGGEEQFVLGPYVEGRYGLGAHGVDPDNNTAWAVLNFNADFAVLRDL